jgi:hypothetical protein
VLNNIAELEKQREHLDTWLQVAKMQSAGSGTGEERLLTKEEERHKKFIQTQVRLEGSKITKFIKDKNNSYGDFLKTHGSRSADAKGGRGLLYGVEMSPALYEKLQEDQIFRESFVHKHVAGAVGEIYIGGGYADTHLLGTGPLVLGDDLTSILSQWTDFEYEVPGYTPPTGKEQITEAYKKVRR